MNVKIASEKGVLEFYRLVCQLENVLSSSTLQAMTVSLVSQSTPWTLENLESMFTEILQRYILNVFPGPTQQYFVLPKPELQK